MADASVNLHGIVAEIERVQEHVWGEPVELASGHTSPRAGDQPARH